MDCSLSAQLPKPKSIRVNGVTIDRDVVAREVQNHPASKPIEAWQAAARALVVRQLLLQEATRLGITAEPLTDEEGRTETPEEASVRALVEREVVTPAPDEAACRRYYAQNAARFRAGDLYEAAHILFAAPPGDHAARAAARVEADAALAVVKADPQTFAGLARARSDCKTSADQDGRLGQVSHGQTVKEFELGLQRMKPGEFAIIETRFGFHVTRLDQRSEGRTLPFEAVRERIGQYLAELVQRRALAQYVSILAGRAEIVGINLAAADSPLVQ
ncbi:MAG: peptidylprolyl isomerase [Variibacter sp.]|nr:peptidylprolyl isomerase [Variibacter sp.]